MRQCLSPSLVISARTWPARSMSSYPMAHKCPPSIMVCPPVGQPLLPAAAYLAFSNRSTPARYDAAICATEVSRDLVRSEVDERIPEGGPADREAGEPGNCRSHRQPLPYVLVVLTAAQDDAADLVAAGTASCGDNLWAVLFPFD